tara:strand:- start:309 stop:716 length:408 start_codon:yes stop_codon:yes gene_type:complete
MKKYQLIFLSLLLVGCSDLIEDFSQGFDEGYDRGFKNSFTKSCATDIRSKIDFVELDNQLERDDINEASKSLMSLISSDSFYYIENYCSCIADNLVDRYSPKELAKISETQTDPLTEKDYNDCQVSLIRTLPFKK